METLTTKLRRSGRDLTDQSARLFKDTREAGKSFAEFVQAEAKDWTDYLRERSKAVGHQGWGLLRSDAIVASLRRHGATSPTTDGAVDAATPATAAAPVEPAEETSPVGAPHVDAADEQA
jgi:hypothetical protein